jgi:hypothetical protein
MFSIIVFVLTLALSLNACSRPPELEPHPWDSALFESIGTPLELSQETPHGHLALQHITFINDYLPGRVSFSYCEKETAIWLVEMLLAMGYTWGDIQIQEFSIEYIYTEWIYQQDVRPRDKSQNVILAVQGQSDKIIVVGAHYDTRISNPGASDNASGMALLLESAQRMRYLDNFYTVIYIFFGAEEMYISGSQSYVDSLSESGRDNILFMVNADSLFEGSHLFYAVDINENHKSGTNAIVNAWDNIAYMLYDQYMIELIRYPDSVADIWSDHKPFYIVDIPVVMLVGLHRYESGEFWFRTNHTTQDCLHKINEEFPGKVERAMWGYSLFLEEMLLHRY